MKTRRPRAVVLLSGGLDSATTLALAQGDDFDCYAMTFSYGQRHVREINCACQVALSMGTVEHRIVEIDLAAFGGSALTDATLNVPRNREEISAEIPITYVPARNTIFLSYALAWAEVLGAWDIYLGVNAMDYSGYPDCRPEYIEAFEKMANLAAAAAVEGKGEFIIHTPIIQMTKAQIIKAGTDIGVDYSITHSCYDPDLQGRPCGQCDSCQLRLKGFAEAGLCDPLEYGN